MKKFPALNVYCCVVVAIAAPLVGAHIHSHKVKYYERDRVTTATWVYSLLSSAAVGACGIFPLVVNRWIQLDFNCKDKPVFRSLLSFSVGGLLGDVFLHLLPEAWGSHREPGYEVSLGLWVTVGLLSFLLVEKVVKLTEEATSEETKPGTSNILERIHMLTDSTKALNVCSYPGISDFQPKDGLKKNGCVRVTSRAHTNGLEVKSASPEHSRGDEILGESLQYHLVNGVTTCRIQPLCQQAPPSLVGADGLTNTIQTESSRYRWLQKDISGYLNLVANCTDNFTHGLAIATSYVADPTVGLLTTLAILCHEIPHEIGDFAILLNSGFSHKEAAKAQIMTACGGLVGVIACLTAEHLSNASGWLLPFTAGGFLYIALVSIIPDLLESTSTISLRQTLVEILAVVMGIFVMALVTIVEKKSCGHMPIHLKH